MCCYGIREAEVYTYKMFIDQNTIKDIDFSKFTYCIDALDTISTKIELIISAKQNSVPLISACGAGNHMRPNSFTIMDLAKTTYDPIAKLLRRELKKHNIIHQKVACSTEQPLNVVIDDNGKRTPASNAFAPAGCGLVIASEVIQDVLQKQD